MPSTMRAAYYHSGAYNVVLKDVPIPEPGPHQVLLKVAAAGVCHSDTFLLSDVLDDKRTYILGHENVGHVAKMGSEVKGIVPGKLYCVYVFVPHGHAPLPGFPPFVDTIGIGENGGFAEYMVADASILIPVPDNISPEVAAVASDSLTTAYNAVHNVAQIRPGTNKKVLIYGVGGLGHQAVQLAKAYGATVYACDLKPAARELAVALGATKAFHPTELIEMTSSQNMADNFKVDVVVDFVGNKQSLTVGQAVVKGHGIRLDDEHGVIVIVGLMGDDVGIDIMNLLVWRTNILTSLYGTKSDLVAALDLISKGVVKPIVSAEPLEHVDKILDELRAGRVTGRKVVVPSMIRKA